MTGTLHGTHESRQHGLQERRSIKLLREPVEVREMRFGRAGRIHLDRQKDLWLRSERVG